MRKEDIKIGDKVKILDPLFMECNAEVVKVDWKKGRAKIEYEFAGKYCYNATTLLNKRHYSYS